jgi:flagellar basal-body rod protein FlgC
LGICFEEIIIANLEEKFMRRKIQLLVFIFVILLCSIASSCNNDAYYIIVFDENNKNLLKNFIVYKKFDTELVEGGNYVRLDSINEEMVMEIVGILHLKIDVIWNNIANANTTRTAEGGAFTRRYLEVTEENGIQIQIDTRRKPIMYDPTHLDAIKTGEMTGYVELSNVDIITEYADLTAAINLYNSIVDFAKNHYDNIMVEKIEELTFEEFKHNRAVEKIMNLQLRNQFLEKLQ